MSEEQVWSDCHNVQCAQGHQVLDTILEVLNVECEKNVYVVGKSIRISEKIGALRTEIVRLRRDVFENEAVAEAYRLKVAEMRPHDLLHHLEWAMAIICNAGAGNWERESKDWQDAARKWVDIYGPLVGPLSAAKAKSEAIK